MTGAETATKWTSYLLRGGGLAFRPSALLGTYTADYLSKGSSFSAGAMHAALQHMAIFYEKVTQQNQAYQLLQDIGSALAVNIQDMLNRSPNRARDLDTYTQSLQALLDSATREEASLDGKYDAAQDDARAKRRIVSDAQRQLDIAVRNKDYVTAGSLQDTVSAAQEESTKAESAEKELRTILDIYENVIEVAQIRLNAMKANREVLVAGVQVVDVPGIADIGIIQGNSTGLRNTGNQGAFGGL